MPIEIYSAKKAQEILGIKYQATFHKLMKRKGIEPVQRGRYLKEEIDRLKREQDEIEATYRLIG